MNSPALPNREKEIFEQALDLASSVERLAFIKGACGGDAALCARVQALLQAHGTDAGFLPDEPEGGTTVVSVSEKLGDWTGRYRLMEKIGEGGCGIVYVAEQEQPVRRRVALKIIKLGMDTKQVIARFEAERQALALMDHPNIARVYDGGATDTGRPYFVLELVRGVRITDFCDQHQLPTVERLKLFIQVCHAIQHAHQKGIIHRDIKPSNILVSLHDDVPVPKVIDFGIAKAVGERLTEKTVYTAMEQFMGTPAYMSPEQAGRSDLDVDTRSDIYALGVLLYELLAGRPPFDPKQLAEAGLEEMIRCIREQEPLRPSTRLSRLQREELTTTAQRRGTEPPKLISLLRGDLDWIVMKCLEKNRTRRYEAANALARDVECYLNQEPITARPPSTAYRVGKFVRRNKVLVAAGAAVGLALVLGIVGSTWQAVRAMRAEREQSRLREDAEKARSNEAAQRQRAEQNEQAALAAKARETEARKQAQAQAYASDMKAAQVALQQNNRGMAIHLLRRHLPKSGDEDLRGLEWRYLWQECQGDELRTFVHSSMVGTAVLSPDGRFVAAVAMDGGSVVWEVASAKRVREFKGAGFGTRMWNAAAFSPDGKWLAIPGPIGVEIRNTADWSVERELPLAAAPFRFSLDGKQFVANRTGGISLWEVGNWAEHVFLTNILAGINRLAVSSDAGQVAGAWDYSSLVMCYDLRTGATNVIRASGTVTSLEISPDGRWLAGGDSNGEIRLWELATLNLVQSFQAHQGWLIGMAFSQDSRLLATGGNEQLIRIWQTATTNKTAELKGHLNEIWSLEFSRDGKSLVSSGKDGTVKCWDLVPRPPRSKVLKLPPKASPIGPLPDGSALVTADWQARITQLWSLPEGQLTGSFGWQEIDQLSTSNHTHFPASQAVVGVSTNGIVHLWSLVTGKLLRSVPLSDGQFYPVSLSPDNRWLVGQSPSFEVALYDLRVGRRVPNYTDSSSWGPALDFSPDGRWLASRFRGHTNYAVSIWDLAAGRERTTLRAHGWSPISLRFSTNSKLLASGGADNHAALWSVEDGKLLHGLLRGHLSGVERVAFSSDGRTLLTTGGDHTVRWWCAATGQEMLSFSEFAESIWNPLEGLLLWQDRQGALRVTTVPSLEEIDTAEGQARIAGQAKGVERP